MKRPVPLKTTPIMHPAPQAHKIKVQLAALSYQPLMSRRSFQADKNENDWVSQSRLATGVYRVTQNSAQRYRISMYKYGLFLYCTRSLHCNATGTI
ncbi:MAG: hypothetical protein NTV84_05015 [Methanoregula sp.]|nr:hypothetical protein [Methanoregula sp.]